MIIEKNFKNKKIAKTKNTEIIIVGIDGGNDWKWIQEKFMFNCVYVDFS